MKEGNILDVYLDHQQNVMVTWIADGKQTQKIIDQYTPGFLVYHPSSNELVHLASLLYDLPQVASVELTKKKLQLGSEKTYPVLEVIPQKIAGVQTVASLVAAWGKYHKYQLFNVDIRLASRYLQDRGVFCNGWVQWDGKRFSLQDEQWSVDYDPPSFSSVSLKVEQQQLSVCFQEPITRVVVDDVVYESDDESELLLSLVKQVQRMDPDIVYTQNGDTVVLPLLCHRAQQCGIASEMVLGRENKDAVREVKSASSYFSYGRILFRPAFYTLKGRAHLDKKHLFSYGHSRLEGLIDISRCANIPLQLVSRLGPGTAISQIQVNVARLKGVGIPWKKNLPETWKSAYELLKADRGGLVLEPRVGVYDQVIELDFSSLYPSIMYRYNISPETLLCECCPGSSMHVPQLGYHICRSQQGLLPEVLKPVLDRRFCYKARMKNKRFDTQRYEALQQAWKWILLVCFGYTGYKNARFGRIECHESITAFSRELLLRAIRVAEQAGYEVLHGIVDSLWVRPLNPQLSAESLARRIAEATGVRMDVEGKYKWIVFLPSKQTGAGALNRYYGVFDTGEIRVRGVEVRQRHSPGLVQQVQNTALKVFAAADDAEQMKALVPQVRGVFDGFARQLIHGKIAVSDLVFTMTVSRDVSEYRVCTLVKAALLQLDELDVDRNPGQMVRYVVVDEQAEVETDRVCVEERLTVDTSVDVQFYLRLLAQAGASILAPFEVTREQLYARFCELMKEEYHGSILS